MKALSTTSPKTIPSGWTASCEVPGTTWNATVHHTRWRLHKNWTWTHWRRQHSSLTQKSTTLSRKKTADRPCWKGISNTTTKHWSRPNSSNRPADRFGCGSIWTLTDGQTTILTLVPASTYRPGPEPVIHALSGAICSHAKRSPSTSIRSLCRKNSQSCLWRWQNGLTMPIWYGTAAALARSSRRWLSNPDTGISTSHGRKNGCLWPILTSRAFS